MKVEGANGAYFVVGQSRCLVHDPDRSLDRHMCIYETSTWLASPHGWVRIEQPQSMHKLKQWLSLCETWDDVIDLHPDILLGPLPAPEEAPL